MPAGATSTWRVASGGFISTAVAAALSYAFQLLIARFMSPRSYNDTLVLLSCYMVCSLPLSPLFLVITRRVVEARLAGQEADIRPLIINVARYITAVGALGVATTVVFRQPIAAWLRVIDAAAVPLVALSVAASALYLLTVSVLLGRLNWTMANGLPVLFGVSRILLSLIAVRPGFEATGTFVAIAGSAALCLGIGGTAALRGIPRGGRRIPIHLGDVGPALILNAAFWLLVQIDTIYVNRSAPLLAARGYAAASALGKMLVYVPVAVGNVLFPLLVESRSSQARRHVLARMIAISVAIDAVALVVIAAAPIPIVRLALGAAHAEAGTLLLPVAAGLAPLSLLGMVLYDALARRDTLVAMTYAAATAAAITGLAFVTPGIGALFAILLAAAGVSLAVGVARALSPRRSSVS